MKTYLSAIVSFLLLATPGFSQTLVDRLPADQRTCAPQNRMADLVKDSVELGILQVEYSEDTGKSRVTYAEDQMGDPSGDTAIVMNHHELSKAMDSLTQGYQELDESFGETGQQLEEVTTSGIAFSLGATGFTFSAFGFFGRTLFLWPKGVTFGLLGTGLSLTGAALIVLFCSGEDPGFPAV